LSAFFKGMDPRFQPACFWSDLVESHGMQKRHVANIFRPAIRACLFLAEDIPRGGKVDQLDKSPLLMPPT